MADDHLSPLRAALIPGESPALTRKVDHHHPSALATGLAEIVTFLRWVVGLFLLIACGWGFIVVGAYFISRHLHLMSLEIAAGLCAVISFGLLFLLEHSYCLSRFMGLRYNPEHPAWASAVFFWALGVPGLLFRSTADPSAATAAQTEAKPHLPGTENQPNNLREIVETVVFVVVLVLLLKSFAAEAFVIPTGSMATTLWGYQKDVVCPQCGYKFPVNCSDEVEKKPPSHIDGCTCPNCRYPIDFNREHINPTCNTGDRVLVAKYFYDTGLVNPQRLDVVVFKYPQEPQKQHVAMNYIKRLIGLPGETIGIYYGKLYVLPAGKGPTYDDSAVPEKDRWKQTYTDHNGNVYNLLHPKEADDLLLRPDSPFEIVRKPPKKILALRRIVFDNDHQPSDLKGKVPPRWADENESSPAWAPDGSFGFRHGVRDGAAMDWLRYRHILREGPEPELITDFMGYNSKAYLNRFTNSVEHPALARNWVGDLILECDATVDEPRGELVLELSKGVDRFQARWDLTSGTCSLWRMSRGQETKLGSAATGVHKKGTYHLRFANVDERLTVWVDDDLPFDDGVVYEAPSDRQPKANDLQPASIGIQGGGVRVQKLQLWRDTYYTVTVSPSSADSEAVQEILASGTSDADKEKRFHDLLSNPDRFGEAFGKKMPALTLYVQPDHYLCLGDNSPESSDGRTWGLVPKRLLLGRALLVYWPFGVMGEPRAGPIR